MTLTAEKIQESNIIQQSELDNLSLLLLENVSIVSTDNEKSIAHKIDMLTSLKDYLIKNIDINSLPSDAQQLKYIKLLSKITEQIEAFEIIIGRKDIEALKRAAKRFALKTKDPIGFVTE